MTQLEILKKQKEECMKDEFFLTIDDFGKVATYGGLPALARDIQRLIIMQPMSYPDDPDMGVGIENYQFEFMDSTTISDLSERINSQINKYIPTSNIGNIVIEVIDNDKNGKKDTIGVLINLSTSKDGKDNMVITFEKASNTGKIESKIYI